MRAEFPTALVERDRVRQEIAADHLLDERVPGGFVDDGHEPEPDREAEHHPDLHDVGEHDQPQHDREQPRPASA